jgi:hypothetical protein
MINFPEKKVDANDENTRQQGLRHGAVKTNSSQVSFGMVTESFTHSLSNSTTP